MKPIPIGSDGRTGGTGAAIALAIAVLIVLLAGCSREPKLADTAVADGVTSRSIDSRGVGQIVTNDVPVSKDFGVYNALIIGIDNYSIWPRLKYAENDATRIGNLLTSDYGFAKERVTRVIGANATRSAMMKALRQKLEDMTERDNLLIYYAGHGQIDPLTNTGFWIPVDGDLTDESTWIPFSTIVDFLRAEGVRAKNIIVLTDSCYGGALANTKGGVTPGLPKPDALNISHYVSELAKRAAKRSRQVLASGGFQEVPDDSLFAELLEQALQKNNFPAIDLELLFYEKVYPAIKVNTQQNPILSRIPFGTDIDGQFVLLRSNASIPGGDGEGAGVIPRGVPFGMPRAPDEDKTTPPADARVVSFTVAPRSVREGGRITITWDTADAEKIDISDIGNVPPSGSKQIPADFSKSYRIRATGSNGKTVTVARSVEVKAVLPNIEYFRASSRSIKVGDPVSVEWSVENADTVELALVGTDRTIMDVPAKGRRELQPRDTTSSLVLTAYNKDKERVGEQISIVVAPAAAAATPPPAPTPATTTPSAPGNVAVAGGAIGGSVGARMGSVRSLKPELTRAVTALAVACPSGLVWRLAFDGDHVCVDPAFRDLTRADNARAAQRVNPNGAYGPNTCINGFVWREARANDLVCVTPDTRAQVRRQNEAAKR